MGKTRNIFKKIRDTKVTFHAKMGTIKDRNGMVLPYQKYVEAAYCHPAYLTYMQNTSCEMPG